MSLRIGSVGAIEASSMLATVLALVVSSPSLASPPIKEMPTGYYGSKVDATTGGDICTVSSGDECQQAGFGSTPGSFDWPRGAAVASDGHLLVVDQFNHRIQELEANGTFLRMYGRDVNETARLNNEAGNENVCPVKPGDKCEAGVESVLPGQFSLPDSLVVEPGTGAMYLTEEINDGTHAVRMQKLTSEGRFVYEIGLDVNRTKRTNLCTEVEIETESVTCGAPSPPGTPRSSAEPFTQDGGELKLALGGEGSGRLLYVADGTRVQEFESDGTYKRALPLSQVIGQLASITADTSGEVYVATVSSGVDTKEGIIYKFTSEGQEIKGSYPLHLHPRQPQQGVTWILTVEALATDAAGRLAISEYEAFSDAAHRLTKTSFGALLDGSTGRTVTEFAVHSLRTVEQITFAPDGEMFLTSYQEVGAYRPMPVGEFITGAGSCAPNGMRESLVTLSCTFHGEVDPWSVSGTEAFFRWGGCTGLASNTPRTALPAISAQEPVSATIEGLRPNETYCFQLAGYDENVKAPELLSGELVQFKTQAVAPSVVGEPLTVAVGRFSAVMFGELNPENANTRYFFEYGPCETSPPCPTSPYPYRTLEHESEAYATTGAVLEVGGLQPATPYHYKLVAVNEAGEASGVEGVLTTASAPKVTVQTGVVTEIGATSASIAGLVDPDGQAAVYSFEIGVYDGAGTEYGVVFSGSAGDGSVALLKTLTLSGLQPGTEYAYRIAAHSGDGSTAGSTAVGEARTFTTLGLPAALFPPGSLALLGTPAIAFPNPVSGGATKTKKHALTRRRGKGGQPRRSNRRGARKRSAHKHTPGKGGK